MATKVQPKDLPRLAKQLDKFYASVGEDSKVGHSQDLLQKYDLDLLVSAIREKYGKVPDGWHTFDRLATPGESLQLSSTLKRRGKATKQSQARNNGSGGGGRNKGKPSQPQARNNTSGGGRKNGSGSGRKNGSGSKPRVLRMMGRGRSSKETKKIDQVGMYFNTSGNNLIQRTGGRRKKANETENELRRYSGPPPKEILNSGGNGYDGSQRGMLTSASSLSSSSLQSESANRLRFRKYIDMQRAGMPRAMMVNCMVSDNIDPDEFFAFLDRTRSVAGLSQPLDIDVTPDPARSIRVSGRSSGIAPPPGLFDSRKATMELIEEELSRAQQVVSATLFDSLLPELDPESLPPPPPPPDTLSEAESSVMGLSIPEGVGSHVSMRSASTVLSSQASSFNPNVPAPVAPPRVPGRTSRHTVGSFSSFSSAGPTTPSSRNLRLSKRIITQAMKKDIEQARAVPDVSDSTISASQDNPELAKYNRMIKAGLPRGAVENCMIRDGVDPELMFGSGETKSHASPVPARQTDYTPAPLPVEAPKSPPSPEEAKAAAAKVMVRRSYGKEDGTNSSLKQSGGIKPRTSRSSSGDLKIQKPPVPSASSKPSSNSTNQSVAIKPPVPSASSKPSSNSTNLNVAIKPPKPSGPKPGSSSSSSEPVKPLRKQPSEGILKLQQSILEKENVLPVPNSAASKPATKKQPSEGILRLQQGIQASLRREKANNPTSDTATGVTGPSDGIKAKQKLLAGVFGAPASGTQQAASNKPKQYKWAIPSEEEGGGNIVAEPSPAARMGMRALLGLPEEPNSMAIMQKTQMGGSPKPAGPVKQIWQKIYSIQYDRNYYYNPETKESTWDLPPSSEYSPELHPDRGNWVVCWSDEHQRGYFYDKQTGESRWELDDAEDERRKMAYQPAPAPTSARTTENGRNFVVANYPFSPSGSNPHELELRDGEVLEVLDKSGNDGWWTGKRVRDGKIGLFPYTFTGWL